MKTTAFKNHKSLIALFACILMAFQLRAQMKVEGKVYYDEDGGPHPTVKVLKDNLPFKELETNNKGKFEVSLPIGHDFMLEISKPYNFTTRLAISTRFPDHIDTEGMYESFEVETDLIPRYEGLDGSIMNYPVMILQYDEKQNAVVNDTSYLAAIRDRFERLMDETDKLENKQTKLVANPTEGEMKRIDLVEFLLKEDSLIREELMLTHTTHELHDKPREMPAEDTKEKEESMAVNTAPITDTSNRVESNRNEEKPTTAVASQTNKQKDSAQANQLTDNTSMAKKQINNTSDKSDKNNNAVVQSKNARKTGTINNAKQTNRSNAETVNNKNTSQDLVATKERAQENNKVSSQSNELSNSDQKAGLASEKGEDSAMTATADNNKGLGASDFDEEEAYQSGNNEVIVKPFYQRTWFYLLLVALAAIIIYLVYKSRKPEARNIS
jgi:hypothetical protein